MKKILITGANGFIGSHLVALCKEKGYEVLEHTRKSYGDISEIRYEKELFKDVEIVFHLASTTHNYNILDNPYLDVSTNVIGTICVLEAMKEYCPKAKLVYVSTFFINNGEPKAIYGASKLCAEHICKSYSRVHGISCSIARLSNVIGIGQSTTNTKKGVINKIVNDLVNNKGVNLYVPSPKRDFVYVKDVVKALMIIADRGIDREVYDVSTGESIKFSSLLEYAKEKSDSKSKINPISPPEFHKQVGTHHWICEPKKLMELGWLPNYDAYQMIDELIEYYKKIKKGDK